MNQPTVQCKNRVLAALPKTEIDIQLAAIMQERHPACKLVILSGQAALVAEQPTNDLRFTLLQKPAHPLALIDATQ